MVKQCGREVVKDIGERNGKMGRKTVKENRERNGRKGERSCKWKAEKEKGFQERVKDGHGRYI